jgi:peroxiredoxin
MFMSTKVAPLLKAGDPAPELELKTDGGELHRLADLTGRPVWVSFLSHAA